ncbi:hypothetical protein REPUB_Repub19eG0079600 [Reevesia pubescens]
MSSRFCSNWKLLEENLLPVEVVDKRLEALANGCPNLQRLVVINANELGLLMMAEESCENLQILKLVGNVDGLYNSLVFNIGLTILAQGCKKLVKLELSGCEGSFDGIKAIGQCYLVEMYVFSC